jgi:hypothetical protein
MKNKEISCNNTLFYFLFFVTLILLCLVVYYYFINNKKSNQILTIEKFDDFSPFNNEKEKEKDECDKEDLKKLRDEWELPYNNNNFGYHNAEPMELPPLTPVSSYPTFNFHHAYGPEGEKIINYKEIFNENAELQGYEMKLLDNNIITN